jgi:hypothetical protein
LAEKLEVQGGTFEPFAQTAILLLRPLKAETVVATRSGTLDVPSVWFANEVKLMM